MRPTRSRLAPLAAGAVLALALVGCGDSDGGSTTESTQAATEAGSDEATDEATEEPTDDATTDATDGGNDDATDDATDGATDDATDGATDGAADTQSEAVDVSGQGLEDRHPNGSILTVNTVRVDRTGIVVGVSAVNGFTSPINLASRGSMWLVDDQGNAYRFRAPDQNSNLSVEPGAELSGDLVFLGVLPADATSLTLKTNVYNADDNIDTSDRWNRSTNPEFLLEGIPVS